MFLPNESLTALARKVRVALKRNMKLAARAQIACNR